MVRTNFTPTFSRAPARQRPPRRRPAYVLVMCLLVIAVSSSIVLTLFNILRLQTAESRARRQVAMAHALADAAGETAIAVLVDQPTFRGSLGPYQVPSQPTHFYSAEIVDDSGDIQVRATGTADACVQTWSRAVTASSLDDRRATLGLGP